MTKEEMIKDCIDLIKNGCCVIEIFEYIEDNSDLDPAEIVNIIYRKDVLGF